MLHLIYILAFTIISFLAISNLIRSLITLSYDSQRHYSSPNIPRQTGAYASNFVPHPELLDNNGQPIKEPLLVMRSISVEDVRTQLDSIYNASPSQTKDIDQEK